jgi:hypothetical protein
MYLCLQVIKKEEREKVKKEIFLINSV